MYQLKVSENSGESVIQCVPALRTPSWNVRYARFGPCVRMASSLVRTQSSKLADHITPIGRFCSQRGKLLGANRSSSRVSDSRIVLTLLVPMTELKWTDPVSSRSHSCCAAVSVTAALLVWFFCGENSVIQRA